MFGTPADKAAAVVRISSEETSDKGAAFQRDIAAVLALDTDKAAVCAVAFYAAVPCVPSPSTLLSIVTLQRQSVRLHTPLVSATNPAVNQIGENLL